MATANEIEIRVTVDDKTRAPFKKIETQLKQAGEKGGKAFAAAANREMSKLGDGSIRGGGGGLIASMRKSGAAAGRSFAGGFSDGFGTLNNGKRGFPGALFGSGQQGVKSFGKVLSGTFGLVKNTISNIGTAISGLMNGIFSLGQAFSTVFDGLGKSAGSITGAIGGVASSVASLGSMLALVGAVAGPALVGIGAIAAAVGGTLATALVAGVGALGLFNVKAREAFTGLGEEISNSLARLTDQSGLTKTFQKMADVFRTTFRNLRTEIKDMMITVQPMLMDLAGGVANLFNTLVPRIQTALKGMGPVIEGFASMLGNLGVGLGDMFIQISEHAKGFGETFRGLGEVFRQVLPALGEFMGIIANQMGPVLQQLAPALRDMVTQLGPVFADALRQLGPLMPPLFNGLTQVMNAIIPMIPPLTEMAITALPALASAIELVNSVMPAFQAAFDAVVGIFNFVIASAKALVLGLEATWLAMTGDFEGAKQKMIESGNALAVAMGQQGTAAGEGFRANIGSRFQLAGGQVLGTVNSMVANITNQQGRFSSAGSSLANSFRSGWVAAANAAVQAVRNTVAQIAALLPGSPAKKGPFSGHGYTKLRGKRMMQDFMHGIRKGGAKLKTAAGDAMGNTAFSIFGHKHKRGRNWGKLASGSISGLPQRSAYSGQGAPSASMLSEHYRRQSKTMREGMRNVTASQIRVAGDCDGAMATMIARLIREGKLRVA
jgi:hypothetical protein